MKSDTLMQERGAFVTLKKQGQLRGCIGYVAPMKPLALTVRDVAAMAAMRDTRFPPVTAQELANSSTRSRCCPRSGVCST